MYDPMMNGGMARMYHFCKIAGLSCIVMLDNPVTFTWGLDGRTEINISLGRNTWRTFDATMTVESMNESRSICIVSLEMRPPIAKYGLSTAKTTGLNGGHGIESGNLMSIGASRCVLVAMVVMDDTLRAFTLAWESCRTNDAFSLDKSETNKLHPTMMAFFCTAPVLRRTSIVSENDLMYDREYRSLIALSRHRLIEKQSATMQPMKRRYIILFILSASIFNFFLLNHVDRVTGNQ